MSQGRTPDTASLFNSSRDYCHRELSAKSIYRLLYEHGDALFPDEYFADLYVATGRRSVPPRILATVMVLQRLGGLSDRDAVDAFKYDTRWKYACGGLDPDYSAFVHTVLVNMRARLRGSDAPTRIFDAVLDVAKDAGLVGERRVLDSTPLYDAVATQDTVTLIRSAIRGVLRAADAKTASALRKLLKRDDSYDTPGKPIVDWDDAEACEAVVDALARDGYAILAFFDGKALPDELDEAVRLLATVLGQDLEEDDEGRFRIARRVARDRVISTVDPEARHGHKTASNSFDGYKGHIAIDPDSELITATAATAGNVGDAEVAEDLLADVLSDAQVRASDVDAAKEAPEEESEEKGIVERRGLLGRLAGLVISTLATLTGAHRQASGSDSPVPEETDTHTAEPQVEVYGDASYGAASVLKLLDEAGVTAYTRVQQPSSIGGRYSQAEFHIDIPAGTVTCPAGITADLRSREDGSGTARFGKNCSECPLRENCTTAAAGRSINVHAEFERLSRHRDAQQDPAWVEGYKATRPKVERKLGHMMRRRHGGRRARVRGTVRVGLDFSLLAAAVNLLRLAQIGVTRDRDGWMTPA